MRINVSKKRLVGGNRNEGETALLSIGYDEVDIDDDGILRFRSYCC